MFPGAPNPIQIQFAPSDTGKPGLVPLILIHDSGGTTFNYFALGDLERDVWAIHDPNYWEATGWEGGVDDMASHYIGLVEAAGIRGPVVLGGWSFGGYVSMAMARILAAGTGSISAAALLLIDSPYPFSQGRKDPTLSNAIGYDVRPAALNDLLNDMPDLARKSVARCDIMMRDWTPPTWQRESSENSQQLADPSTQERAEGQQATCVEHSCNMENRELTSAPPAILVRCKEYVTSQEESSDLCMVDLHRHERFLGWEASHVGFIKAVVEVDANHYNIFDVNDSIKMESLTRSLEEGLAVLDSSQSIRKAPPFQQ